MNFEFASQSVESIVGDGFGENVSDLISRGYMLYDQLVLDNFISNKI